MSFPDGFVWGTATASYQIEGAVHEDGRGETIWDRFSHTPGKISDGTNGDVACDHYHLWREDIGIMAELGLDAYRFSVAWARIYPDGKGKVNQAGLDFYSRLVDGLLEAGVDPALTLYHWDLPQSLQDAGGWQNRDTAEYFADYAYTVFDRLGDRVRFWMTLNEPWVAAFNGHASGVHAPGITDMGAAIRVSHMLNVAHAKATRLFRSDFASAGRIGIALSLVPAVPETDEDHDAATIADGHLNRWFLDPVLIGSYPDDIVEYYTRQGWTPGIQDGDMELISGATVDFIGVNYYFRAVVRRGGAGPLGYETVIPDGAQITEMGWEVYPQGLCDLLVRLHRDYDGAEMYVTENGVAFPDTRIEGGVVQDEDRLTFLHDHFQAALDAIGEGVNLRGYFIWTLMDNFEWAFGQSRRFGIVRTDYATLERTVKKSGLWLRDMLGRGTLG